LRKLLAGALCAILLGGCSAGTRSPVGAVHTLIEASLDGDRGAVWRLIGPATRARLRASAQRAAEMSGRRAIEPEELLAVGWLPPRFHVDEVRELERSGDHSTVEVRGTSGERETVACVRVDGAWKIELPEGPSARTVE
jgi:hypothetical protein